ncbi:MAG: phage replisome organizer N-terminal domain-containing protein [Firmicutes bacterium]|nr:phage replisome organizer N-terminal domain-containing protein [Bacillota bacterium]MDY6159314.1 phage replisome organizer N-terminal domain-containing protein [Candidatus Faecousia sp.]
MATGKRYYWMKLKESFMTSDTIDYFMGLPNGANYVVLYQMLCLKTINTEGRFERKIGAVLIPYDVEKIRRDTKWFSADTIRVALNLYMQFGLIYTDENGVMVIANHKNLVGSETDWAEKKSRQRMNANSVPSLPDVDKGVDNVPTNVPIENRDKRIENREQSLDFISINDDDRPNPENTRIIEEFSRLNGLSISSYEMLSKCDAKTRKNISDVAKTLFAKAVGSDPTEMDEARIFSRVTDEHNKISNDKIYILTCAFYKAADAGHRGQWNYIEAILDDMHGRGITTKDQASEYFNSRRGEN